MEPELTGFANREFHGSGQVRGYNCCADLRASVVGRREKGARPTFAAGLLLLL
jgi:hypothetical protein